MDLVANDLRTGHATRVRAQAGRVETHAASTSPTPNLYLSHGWIDLQVNGFAGHDANGAEVDADTVRSLTTSLWPEGVAAYLPTVITASAEAMQRSLRAIAAAAATEVAGPSVLGAHVEGPWLSPLDGARGAHPLASVRDPDIAEFDDLLQASGGTLRLLTVAPERPAGLELIRHARERDVVVSIGHSMADGDTLRAAVEAGASMSTHLGNGVPAQLPRHPNSIWEQLAEDRLTAGVIFDGHHLPDCVMTVILRSKGLDRVVLVSDSTAVAGMPPGTYDTPVGGRVELRADGRLCLPGTDYLAGSASSLLDCINVAVTRLGCEAADIARLAAENPRRALGIEHDSLTLFLAPPRGPVRVVATVVGNDLRYVDTKLVP